MTSSGSTVDDSVLCDIDLEAATGFRVPGNQAGRRELKLLAAIACTLPSNALVADSRSLDRQPPEPVAYVEIRPLAVVSGYDLFTPEASARSDWVAIVGQATPEDRFLVSAVAPAAP